MGDESMVSGVALEQTTPIRAGSYLPKRLKSVNGIFFAMVGVLRQLKFVSLVIVPCV
jgi:hypothetical protein